MLAMVGFIKEFINRMKLSNTAIVKEANENVQEGFGHGIIHEDELNSVTCKMEKLLDRIESRLEQRVQNMEGQLFQRIVNRVANNLKLQN